MTNNFIGYYRVSSKSQELNSSLQTQRKNLLKAGVLEKIFILTLNQEQTFVGQVFKVH